MKRSLTRSWIRRRKCPLGTTLQGVIENEDVDYWKFTAKKGDRLSLELEGIRLGTINMDPYVAILDAKKFELATCDDSSLLLQDAYVSVIAPADGVYYAEIRDSSYIGNGNYRYRAHLGSFPRPSTVLSSRRKGWHPSGSDLSGRCLRPHQGNDHGA